MFVLIVGVVSLIAGLWTIDSDINELSLLFNESNGWVFTVPIILVAADVFSTLAGLRYGSEVVELNPFVQSAVNIGVVALALFITSYLALSAGTGLLMMQVGRWLFGPRSSIKFLPFSAVCGAASIGAFSNLSLLATSNPGWFSYIFGVLGGAVLGILVYTYLRSGDGQAERRTIDRRSVGLTSPLLTFEPQRL